MYFCLDDLTFKSDLKKILIVKKDRIETSDNLQ